MLEHYGRSGILLLTLAIAGAATLGVALRAADPASTTVIPAEDPYTHLALTREHLRDGTLDGLAGGAPYPPGLHAVLAVATVYSGVDLTPIVRFGPPVFGVVGVVGVALLLLRLDGATAAAVGAFAYAVTPELIFRQAMMSPTALDLAILPYTLLALVEVLRGRLAWSVPAAVLLSFLVIAHPWLFGVIGLTGVAFLALAFVMPWADLPRVTATGLATATALLGVASGLALSGCWGGCGPGFAEALGAGFTDVFDRLALTLVAGSIAVAGTLWLARGPLERGLRARRPLPGAIAAALAVGLVALAVAVAVVAKAGGLPQHVDAGSMAGFALLAVALGGLAAAPFARRPAAHVACALAVATVPFTLFDPFHSPFWPHRTAAYLGVALALLAGVAAGFAARLLAQLLRAHQARRAAASPGVHPGAWRAALAPGLLVGTLLAATLVSAAPARYPGWYRLFDECEDSALRDVAARAEADPSLVVVAGSWQAKLVIASQADDASRIWYQPDIFTNKAAVARLATFSDDTDRPVLVLAERQAMQAAGANANAKAYSSWEPAGSWPCPSPVTAHLRTPT